MLTLNANNQNINQVEKMDSVHVSPFVNFCSFILFTAGWILHSVSSVYDVVFKTLSLISVLMVIIINYPKFKERIKKIRIRWRKK